MKADRHFPGKITFGRVSVAETTAMQTMPRKELSPVRESQPEIKGLETIPGKASKAAISFPIRYLILPLLFLFRIINKKKNGCTN